MPRYDKDGEAKGSSPRGNSSSGRDGGLLQGRSPRTSPRQPQLGRTAPIAESKRDGGLSESKRESTAAIPTRRTFNPITANSPESKSFHNDPPVRPIANPLSESKSESKSENPSVSRNSSNPSRQPPPSSNTFSESKEISRNPSPRISRPIQPIETKESENNNNNRGMNRIRREEEREGGEGKRPDSNIISNRPTASILSESKKEDRTPYSSSPSHRNNDPNNNNTRKVEDNKQETKREDKRKDDIKEDRKVTFSPSTKPSSPPPTTTANSNTNTNTKTESKISEEKSPSSSPITTTIKKVNNLGSLETRFGLKLTHQCVEVYNNNNIEQNKDRITLNILEKCFDEFNIKMNKDSMEIFLRYRDNKSFELPEFCSLISQRSDLWKLSDWSKKLTNEIIEELEIIFNKRCSHMCNTDDDSNILPIDRLEESFRDIGRIIEEKEMNKYINQYRMNFFGNNIILSDFCFLYYKMYYGQPNKGIIKGSVTSILSNKEVRDLDINIQPISKIAAQILSEGDWKPTKQNYMNLVRRLSAGRPNSVIKMIHNSLNLFKKLDKNNNGYIEIKYINDLLKGIGVNMILDKVKEEVEMFYVYKKDQPFSYLEFLDRFGYFLEEQRHTVSSAVSILKYSNEPSKVLEILKVVKNQVEEMILNPSNMKLWTIHPVDDTISYILKYVGAKELLESVGYRRLRDEVNTPYVLADSEDLNHHKYDRLSENSCNRLKTVKDQIDNEITLLEGATSIITIMKDFENNNVDINVLYEALKQLKIIVDGILLNQNQYKRWRITKMSKVFNFLKFDKKNLLIQSIGFNFNGTYFILQGTETFFEKKEFKMNVLPEATKLLLHKRSDEINKKIEEYKELLKKEELLESLRNGIGIPSNSITAATTNKSPSKFPSKSPSKSRPKRSVSQTKTTTTTPGRISPISSPTRKSQNKHIVFEDVQEAKKSGINEDYDYSDLVPPVDSNSSLLLASLPNPYTQLKQSSTQTEAIPIANGNTKAGNKAASSSISSKQPTGTATGYKPSPELEKMRLPTKSKIPRNIEKKIQQKDAEIKQLTQTVTELKQNLLQALEPKDIMTINRMNEKEQKRTKTLASKVERITGLEKRFQEPPPPMRNRIYQTPLTKLLTTTAAVQVYDIKSNEPTVGTTTLLKEAKSGDYRLELVSTAGFDKDNKILIGNPPRCETKFVVEIDPFIIDAPLQMSHRAGVKVVTLTATKREKKRFYKKKLSEYFRDLLLKIVDDSCNHAEEIIASRMTQYEYQKRPINKSCFYYKEIFKYNFPKVVDLNCGYVFYNKFGRLLIFHNKTVWAFQEGFRLNDLRQIFDECDKEGSGYVYTKEYIKALLNHPFILPIVSSHPFGMKLDMNIFEDKLQTLEEIKDRITWSEFIYYFRYGTDSNSIEKQEDNEINGAWRKEPWASILKDEDVIKIRKIFNQYDINGTGEIKLDELNTIFWEIDGVAASNDNLKKWFAEIDTDGSGTISFAEFVCFILKAAESNTSGQSFNFTMKPLSNTSSNLLDSMSNTITSDDGRRDDDNSFSITSTFSNNSSSRRKKNNTNTSLSLSEYLSFLKPRNVFDIVFCQTPTELVSSDVEIYEIKPQENSGRLLVIRNDGVLEQYDGIKGQLQSSLRFIPKNATVDSLNRQILLSDYYPKIQILECERVTGISVINTSFLSGELVFVEPILCNKIHTIKCDLQRLIERSRRNDDWHPKNVNSKNNTLSSVGYIDNFTYLHEYSLCFVTVVGSSMIFGINVLSGDIICELQGHYSYSPILYYCKESKCLLTGGRGKDTTVRVWDLGETLFWKLEIIQRKKFYEDIREKHSKATEANERWNEIKNTIIQQFNRSTNTNNNSKGSEIEKEKPKPGIIAKTYQYDYIDVQYNEKDKVIETGIWKGRVNLPENKRQYLTEDTPVSVYPKFPSMNILIHLLHTMDYENSGVVQTFEFQNILKEGINLDIADEDMEFICLLFDEHHNGNINYINFIQSLKKDKTPNEIYSIHLNKLYLDEDEDIEGKNNITISKNEKWNILLKKLKLIFSDFHDDKPKEGMVTRYYHKNDLVDVRYTSGEKERDIWKYRLDLPLFDDIQQNQSVKVFPVVTSLQLFSRYFQILDSNNRGYVGYEEFRKIIKDGINLNIDDVDIVFIFKLFSNGYRFKYKNFIKELDSPLIKGNEIFSIEMKKVLKGHEAEITGIAYLKESRLIVSSSKDGTIKLWDPMACKYRLTHPASISHIRLGTGKYKLPKDQWTTSTTPYNECLTINLNNNNNNNNYLDNNDIRYANVINSSYLQCSSLTCPIYADKKMIQKSKEIEEQLKVENGGVVPKCFGYIYLMDDGTLFDVSIDHFDLSYITLRDNESFLEEQLKSIQTGNDISALQKILAERHKVKRILFGGSNDYDNLRQLKHRLTKEGILSLTYDDILHILSNPIVHFSLFYCTGDGPNNICSLEGKDIERFNNEFRLYHGIVISNITNERVDVAYDNIDKIENVPIDSLRSTFDDDLNKVLDRALIRVGSPVLIKSNYLSSNLDEDNVVSQHYDALDLLITEIIREDGSKSILSFSIGRINIRVKAMDYDVPLSIVTKKRARETYKIYFQNKFQHYRSRVSIALSQIRQEDELQLKLMKRVGTNLRASCLNPQIDQNNENVIPKLIFQYVIRLPLHWDVNLPPIMQSAKIQFASEASTMGKVSVPIFLTGIKTELNPLTIPFLTCLCGDRRRDNGVERDILGYNTLPDYSIVLTWKDLKRAVESVHARSLAPTEAYWVIKKYGLLSPPNQTYPEFLEFCKQFIVKKKKSKKNKEEGKENEEEEEEEDPILGFSITESFFVKLIGELDPKNRIIRAQNKLMSDIEEQRDNIAVSPPYIDWTGDGKIDANDNMSGIQRYIQMIKSRRWLKKLDIIGSSINVLLSHTQKRVINILSQYISGTLLLHNRNKDDNDANSRSLLFPSYLTPSHNILICQLFRDNVLPDRCSSNFISYSGWGSYNQSDLDEGESVCISIGKVLGNTPRHRDILLKVYAKIINNPYYIRHFPQCVLKEGEDIEIDEQYHVSENLNGWKSLDYYLARHGRLSGENGFMILKLWLNQLYDAIIYLHHKHSTTDIGFALCSLSPKDILISPDGSTLKISNLYSTVPIGDNESEFKERLILDGLDLSYDENNQYMSPELFKYLKNPKNTMTPSRRTDTWSFGCIIIELLSGKKPQSYKSLYDKFQHIQKNAYKLLSFVDENKQNELFFFDFFSLINNNDDDKSTELEILQQEQQQAEYMDINNNNGGNNNPHNNIYDSAVVLQTLDNITLGDLLEETPVEVGGLLRNEEIDLENKHRIIDGTLNDVKRPTMKDFDIDNNDGNSLIKTNTQLAINNMIDTMEINENNTINNNEITGVKTLYSIKKTEQMRRASKLMLSVINVLVLCFQTDQNRRPVLDDLRALDFFYMTEEDIEKAKKVAFQYVTSPKTDIILNELFIEPLLSLEMSLDRGVFDTIEFTQIMDRLLTYLIINDNNKEVISPLISCTIEYKKHILKEIFKKEIILKVVNLALRFMSSKIGQKVGYGNNNNNNGENRIGNGYLEGKSSETIGEKVIRRVVYFLFSLCYELRDLDSLLSPYVNNIIYAILALYSGNRTFNINKHYNYKTFCWTPTLYSIVNPLVVYVITEEGKGNPSLPVIRDYIEFITKSSQNLDIYGSLHQNSLYTTHTEDYYSDLVMIGDNMYRITEEHRTKKAKTRKSGVIGIASIFTDIYVNNLVYINVEEKCQLLLNFNIPERLCPLLYDVNSEVIKELLTLIHLIYTNIIPLEYNVTDPRYMLGLKFCTIPYILGYVYILKNPKETIENRRLVVEIMNDLVKAGDMFTRGWSIGNVFSALVNSILKKASDVEEADILNVRSVFYSLYEYGGSNLFRLLSSQKYIQRFLEKKGFVQPPIMSMDQLVEKVMDLENDALSTEILDILHPIRSQIQTYIMEHDYLSNTTTTTTSNDNSVIPLGIIEIMRKLYEWFDTTWNRINDFWAPVHVQKHDVSTEIEVMNYIINMWKWMLGCGKNSLSFYVINKELMNYENGNNNDNNLLLLIDKLGSIFDFNKYVTNPLVDITSKINMLLSEMIENENKYVIQEANNLNNNNTVNTVIPLNISQTMTKPKLDILSKRRTIVGEITSTKSAIKDRDTIKQVNSSQLPIGSSTVLRKPVPPSAKIVSSLENNDNIITQLADYGIGLKFIEDLSSWVEYVMNCVVSGTVHIHLLDLYPSGRYCRHRLWDVLLSTANEKIENQILYSGIIEYIIDKMLGDRNIFEVLYNVLPVPFSKYNHTCPIRSEAIFLLKILIERRVSCEKLISELIRHIKKYEVIPIEISNAVYDNNQWIRYSALSILRLLAESNHPQIIRLLRDNKVPIPLLRLHIRFPTQIRLLDQGWNEWIDKLRSDPNFVRYYGKRKHPEFISQENKSRIYQAEKTLEVSKKSTIPYDIQTRTTANTGTNTMTTSTLTMNNYNGLNPLSMTGTQTELSAIDELVLSESSRQMYRQGRETLQERSICFCLDIKDVSEFRVDQFTYLLMKDLKLSRNVFKLVSLNVLPNTEIYVNFKAPLGVVVQLSRLLKTGMLSNMSIIKWLDVEDQPRLYRDGTTVMPINNTATLMNTLSNTLNMTTSTIAPMTDQIHNTLLTSVSRNIVEESKVNTHRRELEVEEEGEGEESKIEGTLKRKAVPIEKIINGDRNYSTQIISQQLSKAIAHLDDDLIRLQEYYEEYAVGDNQLMKDKIDIIVEKMGYNIGSELYQNVVKQITKTVLTFSDAILLIDYLIENNQVHYEWIESKNRWNNVETKIIDKIKVTVRLCKPNDYPDKCLIDQLPDILKTFDIDVSYDEIRRFADKNCECRDILDLNDVVKVYIYFSDKKKEDESSFLSSSQRSTLYKTKFRTLNNTTTQTKKKSFEGGSGTLRYGRFKKNE